VLYTRDKADVIRKAVENVVAWLIPALQHQVQLLNPSKKDGQLQILQKIKVEIRII